MASLCLRGGGIELRMAAIALHQPDSWTHVRSTKQTEKIN